jgi:rubredoxin
MKKFVCSICGYVHEGDAAPEKCPVCGVGAEKFVEQSEEKSWAAEHVVGVAKGVSEDIAAYSKIILNILKSVYTGKKLLGKKLSTLLNSLNY